MSSYYRLIDKFEVSNPNNLYGVYEITGIVMNTIHQAIGYNTINDMRVVFNNEELLRINDRGDIPNNINQILSLAGGTDTFYVYIDHEGELCSAMNAGFDMDDFIKGYDEEEFGASIEEIFKTVKYVNYTGCDSDGCSPGGVMYYGYLNGILCAGGIKETCKELPRDGEWRDIFCTDASIDSLKVSGNLREDIIAHCNELTKFSEFDELAFEGERISYYMNNLWVKNADELEQYVRLAGELERLVQEAIEIDEDNDERGCILGFLTDVSEKTGPRTLELTYKGNGKFNYVATPVIAVGSN